MNFKTRKAKQNFSALVLTESIKTWNKLYKVEIKIYSGTVCNYLNSLYTLYIYTI